MTYLRPDGHEMIQYEPHKAVNRGAYELGILNMAQSASGASVQNVPVGNSLVPWRAWLEDGEWIREAHRHGLAAIDKIVPKLWCTKPSAAVVPKSAYRAMVVKDIVYRMLNGIPGWRRI